MKAAVASLATKCLALPALKAAMPPMKAAVVTLATRC